MSVPTSIPHRYTCQISMRTMGDPVAMQHEGDADAGPVAHIFSRAAIEDWRREHSGCPLDRRNIVRLIPQPGLQREIREFVAAHPGLFEGRGPEAELDAPLREVHETQQQRMLDDEEFAGGQLDEEEATEREMLRYRFAVGSPTHRGHIFVRHFEERPGVSSREFAGAPLDDVYREGNEEIFGMHETVTFHVRDPYHIVHTRVQFLPPQVLRTQEREGTHRQVILHLAAPDRSGFRLLSETPSLLQSRRPLAPVRTITLAFRAGDNGVRMSLSAFKILCVATTIASSAFGAACALAF